MSVFELFISAIFVNNIVLGQYLATARTSLFPRQGVASAWAAR